jgi:DNA-binding transcriptional ArsR family regulator
MGRQNLTRREQIRTLLDQDRTVTEIARELGVSARTVCYHARKLGRPRSSRFQRRYDWAEVQRFYDAGHSISECQEKFGMARRTFEKAVLRGDVTTRPQATPIDELLVVGRGRNRTHLKRRLLGSGLKENRCERCGITEWRGEPLSMQLHHRNGDGTDNRLENLVFLCANCHSLTESHSRKRGRRVPADQRIGGVR